MQRKTVELSPLIERAIRHFHHAKQGDVVAQMRASVLAAVIEGKLPEDQVKQLQAAARSGGTSKAYALLLSFGTEPLYRVN